MSIKLLIREYPYRSIALATQTHALIFRHDPAANESGDFYNGRNESRFSLNRGAAAPKCTVEFNSRSSIDLEDYRPLGHSCKGTLGLINIGGDVFLCVVTGSSQVATVRPGERVERIHTVDFHCLTRSDYDRMLEAEFNSYHTSYLDEDGFDYSGRQPIVEHPCLAVKKLLSGGTFYYSTDFDLTNRLQDRSVETAIFDIDNFDPFFLWNSYMINPLIKFRSCLSAADRQALDSTHILTSAIRGFVETLTIPHSSSFTSAKKVGMPGTLTLISRLSCKRAGTRFNARGIDDEGNVANFVETEVVIWHPSGAVNGGGLGFSYCQVRGSVPVFWEQQAGLLPNQQKITLSRSVEATQPAFDRHFESLIQKYGPVHVVNLLSATKVGEVEISSRFRHHIRNPALNHDSSSKFESFGAGHNVSSVGGAGGGTMIRATEYDFHAETQGRYEAAHAIRHLLEHSADGFAFFLMEETGTPSKNGPTKEATVVLQQEGIFRTNCLDCLDRTNLVQGIISQVAIESFIYYRGDDVGPDFWMRHSTLWADNGDALSKIYAGTGALKSSFTRHGKTSLGGLLADAKKSATRLYINNFVDSGRQETINCLLGRQLGQQPVVLYDPINDYVNTELGRRVAEYSSTKVIQIYVGTLNLNGQINGINSDLSLWLFPDFVGKKNALPEIVVLGFQEIVELSPQQIMSTDPVKRQMWEKAVLRTLNGNAAKQGNEEYILLRSGQLVGAALLVYVKSNAIQHIRNVEGNIKKTGMSGIAGNKGAVAIRMEYANTKLCFVTAHFAAGFANYEERNRDYMTISHGLRFQRGLSIDSHDSVIWLGDFNYRIGLPDEKARRLIETGDLKTLYDNDQLNLQMIAGLTFPYYSESRPTFKPTYKFDIGTDNYDTSDKARIPAWCDRILRKGTNLRQISYDSVPLRFSDHRPVYATFECTISIIDEDKKEKLSRQIYFQRLNASVISLPFEQGSDGEDDLLIDEQIACGLPPPSSDKRKWWLENGNLAQSLVESPGPDYILNPERLTNPFKATDKPDWIKSQSSLIDADGPPLSMPALPPRNSTDSTYSALPKNVNDPGTLSNEIRRLSPPYKRPSLPQIIPLSNAASTDGSLLESGLPTTNVTGGKEGTSHNLRTAASSSAMTEQGTKAPKLPPPVPRKPTELTTLTGQKEVTVKVGEQSSNSFVGQQSTAKAGQEAVTTEPAKLRKPHPPPPPSHKS